MAFEKNPTSFYRQISKNTFVCICGQLIKHKTCLIVTRIMSWVIWLQSDFIREKKKKSLDAKLIFSYECVGDEAVIR